MFTKICSFVLTFSTFGAFACQLSTPIDLNTLSLDVQRAVFWQVDSNPRLQDVIPLPNPTNASPVTLNLSFTQIGETDVDADIIGARLSFNDTVNSFGLSDLYTNVPIERSRKFIGATEVHTVSSEHFNSVTKTTVTIKNNKIISILIEEKGSNFDKKLCVTKAM